VRVTVGETDTNFNDPPEDEICDYLPGHPQPADIFLVTCHTRMYGRYVRVTAVEVNNFLNIYELEIHGLKLFWQFQLYKLKLQVHNYHLFNGLKKLFFVNSLLHIIIL